MFDKVVATREFNVLYIIIDSIFILGFLTVLILKKRYTTVLFSLFGGVLYFIVDFGYFYLISKSRTVSLLIDESFKVQNWGITFLVLLWMSLSYGISNFAFIWICLSKDKYMKEMIFAIIIFWLLAPSISSLGGVSNIQTSRTTYKYHAPMAIIMLVGYLGLIIYNLFNKKGDKVNILKLNLIGISVQFCWEFALLINGIRPFNSSSIFTLILNSLIETNLGMPYIYFIHKFVNSKISEDLKPIRIDMTSIDTQQCNQ